MSKTNNRGLVLAGLGTAVTFAWLSSRKKKTASKTTPSTKPNASPAAASPFVAGSYCTQLAAATEVDRWLTTTVAPKVELRLDAFDVPLDQHEAARLAVAKIVDDVFAASVPECPSVQSQAASEVWKWLWCDVVAQLVLHGKVDEELDDVLRLCADPNFDPRLPTQDGTKPPVPHGKPRPPVVEPRPHPLPPPPRPLEPTDRTTAPLPNLWTASTRKELSALGVMRMMEGTAAGAPIRGPSKQLVLFAASPFWPRIEQARAELARLAAEHPQLSFIEVSFADTQRHFGKPRDLGGLTWVLTSAGPDGRVFPSPIVRDDSRDGPPSPEQWAKLIAHASGFVGSPPVRRIVRPRRFGDLTRAMAARRRSTAARPRRLHATPRRSSRRLPRRRGG